MAMTAAELAALNQWSALEPALADKGVALGTALDNGQALGNDIRDKFIVVPLALPAAAGSAATKDFPAFVAPAAGSIVSAHLVSAAGFVAGNHATDKWLFNVRRYNNTAAQLSKDHDFLSGMAAGSAIALPTGASSALLTAGQNLAITVASTVATFTNAVAWVTQPQVGDYISLNSAATSYVGAGLENAGIYLITAVTATTIVATKLNLTSPAAVTAAAAQAADVTELRLISQVESSFAAGDVLGARAIVPVNTNTPVAADLSGLSVVLRIRLA